MPQKKNQKKFKSQTSSVPYDKLILKIISDHKNKILTHRQICGFLHVKDQPLRKLVFDKLVELSRNGMIKRVGHSEFSLSKNEELLTGRLSIVNSGVGFVTLTNGSKDIFVSPANLSNAMDGDEVAVRILKSSGKRIEGEIVTILKRERSHIVGSLRLNSKQARLIPDNPKLGGEIFIENDSLKNAKHGDRVIVKIIHWPEKGKLWGEVTEILTGLTNHDSEMLSILCYNGIPFDFPEEVIQEAENTSTELEQEEIKKRRDFKGITTFTIDPIDAKDFDDALSFDILENDLIEVGIHIADVGHYVPINSQLDKEAQKRGNSVYLANRVIPMLPEQLSNIACSLRPNEDKYCFSVVLQFNEKFEIVNEWFGKTRIFSKHRFTYEEAQEIIETGRGIYSDEILLLDKIAKYYRSKRLKKGALNIESEEIRFRFDENGEPDEVVIKKSKDAHKLIEEFMLLANKKVAEFIGKPRKNHNVPTSVYRIHDLPDPAKIDQLKVFLDKFGLTLNSFDPKHIASSLNALFDKIKGNAESGFIQSLAIRTMAKAAYDIENIGHYGLSFEYYSHFTSPIRRYADLLIHRILLEELTHKKHHYKEDKLQDICKHISKMERKAADAERESAKYFQTLYVADSVGQIFHGIVTGIADHGLFVRMNENLCEGMVPIQEIPGDRFFFDQNTFKIIGARTKKEYNFGDTVTVKIIDVKPKKRQIDLELID
jgi:ribonuclease R